MLKNTTTVRRISLIYLSMLTIFILLISIVVFVYAKQYLYRTTSHHAMQILAQTSSQAEAATYSVDQTSKLLMSEVSLMNVLEYPTYLDLYGTNNKERIVSALNDFIFVNPYVEAAFIFDYTGHVYGTRHYTYPYTLKELDTAANSANGKLAWYTQDDSGLLVLCRKLYSSVLKPIGTMAIMIDTRLFDDVFYWQQSELGSQVCVYDTNRQHLIYSSSAEIANYVTLHPPTNQPPGNDIAQKVSVSGQSYGLYQHTSQHHGFSYLYFVPLDYFTQGLSQVTFIIICITAVFIWLLLLLTFRLNTTLGKPISLIGQSIKDFTLKGDIAPITFDYNDEFKELYDQFCDMAQRINHLVESTYEQEILSKTQELTILQAQINPHFIYNTFELINSIAMDNDVTPICIMTKSLSNIMRYTINNQQFQVTLQDELQHVNDYINIQQQRFMGGLSYVADVPQALLTYPVLRLILQPIIENCIHHAFGKRWDNCVIAVTGQVVANGFVLNVIDNGQGMDNLTLENIFKDGVGTSGRGNGIAIKNIDRRLRLQYGADSGLSVKSTPGNGTTVKISIVY